MTITTTTVHDDDQTELGETHEAEGLVVYEDRTGYLALDVPRVLTRDDAGRLYALLGKVLGEPAASAAV